MSNSIGESVVPVSKIMSFLMVGVGRSLATSVALLMWFLLTLATPNTCFLCPATIGVTVY